MSKQKKLLIVLILSGVVLLSLVGTTLAYFVFDTDSVVNMFSMGQLNVGVEEEFEPPVGSIAVKQVWLRNTGSVDEYVRAMLVPVFRQGGDSQAGSVDYSGVNANGTVKVTSPDGEGVYTLHLAGGWEQNWYFSGSDNIFYYRKVLPSGERTGQLLDRVVSLDDKWRFLEIEVLADAVQTDGDPLAEHLRTQWGVTAIDPDDGTLSWN